MHDCHTLQDCLLDHLYGLLDDQETQALLTHVAACPACHAALDEARGQKDLLARAALLHFPEVRFEPPTDEPATIPLSTTTPRRRGWLRWAAAAAVLLTVAGLSLPVARLREEYANLRQQVALDIERVNQAQFAASRAATDLTKLPAEYQRKKQEALLAAEARRLNVFVVGPAQAPVGARSDYQISTRTLRGAAAPARVDVRVVDSTGRALLEEKNVPTRGEHRISLPANLDLRPGTTLALEVAARREGDDDPQGVLSERIELSAPDYVTHLATDKPIYLPGETVRFRSLTLERFSHRPPERDFPLHYSVTWPTKENREILTGRSRLSAGELLAGDVLGPDGKPVRGVGTGEWAIAPDAPVGEYTLTVREANNRFMTQTRKFFVHRYEPGPFRKELEFDRASYGPGDQVTARCRALLPDGTPLAGARLRPTVLIDGIGYGSDGKAGTESAEQLTDAQGQANLTFTLPAQMKAGRGTLAVRFEKGENDTLVRPLPIALSVLQVDFFPEGGELVAGHANRVYFQVRTSLDRPGDLRGGIVDDRGTRVADIRTLRDASLPGVNRGMGEVAFTPEMGRSYELKIDEPRGISSKHPLPAVRAEGVVLTVPDGVTRAGEPIRVGLRASGGDRSFLVGIYCRGRLLDQQTLTIKKGEKGEAVLRPEGTVGGVCRITVFEDRGAPEGRQRTLVPVAERLVYRDVGERLKLAVQADKPSYSPGEKVTLTVTARDEANRTVGAVVLLRVVDRRTLALADEKSARSLPTHFFLTGEVRRAEDLEQADFLLTDHPQARIVLDLLLGTQGWRRFAEQNPTKFRQDYGSEAERVLASAGTTMTNFLERESTRLKEEYRRRTEELQAEQERTWATLVAHRGEGDAQRRAEQLWHYEDLFHGLLRWGVPSAAALVALAVIVCLLSGGFKTLRRAVPLYSGAAVCLVGLALMALHNSKTHAEREALARSREATRLALADWNYPRIGAPGRANPAPAPGPVRIGPLSVPPVKGGLRVPLPPGLDRPYPGGDGRRGPTEEIPPQDNAGGRGAADAFNLPDLPPLPPPLLVREYSHTRLGGEEPALGNDFTDMLLWRPVFIVPGTGQATTTFELPDSVTSFEVTAWGHTLDGRLGAVTSGIESRPGTARP